MMLGAAAVAVCASVAILKLNGSGALDAFSDWKGFRFGHGGGGATGHANVDLGEFTTDVHDTEGGVYTANLSVTVELTGQLSEDERKHLVATGRHAVLEGVRDLNYGSFAPENFDEARVGVTKRVEHALGKARVGRVLFTDLAFYPGTDRPPIAPIAPLAPPRAPVERKPIPPMAPFSHARGTP